VLIITAAAFAGMAAASTAAVAGKSGTAMLQVTADGTIAPVAVPSAAEVKLAKVDTNTSKVDTWKSTISRVLTSPFAEGWDVFVDCVNDCSEGGGEALACAHQCYADLSPIYQDLPEPDDILGTGPPPTPFPTPSTTPGPEQCNGNDECLWMRCCHAYTAECLSCVVEVPPQDLCMMSQYLSVPGCGQALLSALQEERSKRQQREDTFWR
jgi:hypothetical protein